MLRLNKLIQQVFVAGAAWLIGLPAPAQAGGWTQPEGAFYVKAWDRTLLGPVGENKAYFSDGEIRPTGQEFSDHLFNLYGEYGVTDDWTGIFHGGLLGRAAMGDESATYVGPLSLGVRRALSKGDLRIALEGRYVFAPGVGHEPIASGNEDGHDWHYSPTVSGQGGHGELQLGKGTGFGWWTASAGGSYLSADGVGASLTAGTQIGWKLSEAVYLPLTLSLVEPLDEVRTTNVAGAGRTRYLGFSLDVSWWFHERIAVTTGFAGVVYAASNAATPSLNFGIEAR